jgi:2-desacetyl-2-hydroxyethyl bacteriochlorophyllide A dehydrogenase
MGKSLSRLSLYFTNTKSIEIRQERVPPPGPGEVLIRSEFSAISAGTELLVYRHLISTQQPLDTVVPSLSGDFRYPVKYGYSVVGKIVDTGSEIDRSWMGKRIFTFHPHESLFPASLTELLEIPGDLPPLDALFLPNMESAVNFIMDGRPSLGEKVIIFGQGIVGLLTLRMLAQFPLKSLITLDPLPLRRRISQQSGAHLSLDPTSQGDLEKIVSILGDENSSGADLTYELSGNPEALNQAIAFTGFEGRVVVGSWYGSKPVHLTLDETFHRSRIKLISSQVSTIASGFQGRWNKSRRFQTVWQMLEKIRPSQFISHQLPITRAADAYRTLDENPGDMLQIIFTYPDAEEDDV